jgi:hypothetical protein
MIVHDFGGIVPMLKGRLRPNWAVLAGAVAITFGLATLFVGGRTLFAAPADDASARNIVPFVLWFNFIAGFAYVAAGLGLVWWKGWAAQLSALIAAATVLVFIAFGVHVAAGGAFEMRTVAAMTARSAFWLAIAIGACRALGCLQTGERVK